MAVKKLSAIAAASTFGQTDTLVGVSSVPADLLYTNKQVVAYAGVINVKDFGAKGDGSTDDTAAIQAALNAAFGVAGSIQPTSQRRVIIPPGLYIVRGGGLTGVNWFGGCISGAGRFTTQIQNADGGPVISTNGCEYMRFEDMNLDGAGGTGILFDLDWFGSGTALQSNTFFNMYFSSAGIGIRIANDGNMGSENLILNCFFGNCSTAGLQVVGFNALQQTIVGGNFQNGGKGVQIINGSVNTICGVGFQQSITADISIEGSNQNTMSVIGCRSESPNFIANPGGQSMQVGGCHQTSGIRGLFLDVAGGVTHVSGCLFNGQVHAIGWVRLCIQACQPFNEIVAGDWLIENAPDWWYIPNNPIALSIEVENVESFLAAGGALGLVIDKQRLFTTDGVTITTLNYLNTGTVFASLPSPASSIGGNALITDCNTSTWGALAGGGGTVFAEVFSDGRAWYVSGVGSLSRVTPDAIGTKLYVAGPSTTASYTGITVGSGSKRALLVSLNFGFGGSAPSGVTVTWDSGGTNQAMTQIVVHNDTHVGAQIWGLVAPASGNKTLAISWTNNAEVFVVAESFTNVDQTGGATTFPNSSASTVNSVNPKITITSGVDHAVFGSMAAGNTIGTLLGVQIYKDGTGAFVEAAASYVLGEASADVGWTGGSNIVTIAGTDIVNG